MITVFPEGTESDGETWISHRKTLLQMEMPQEALIPVLPARSRFAVHILRSAHCGSNAGRKSREVVLIQTHNSVQLQGFRSDVLWTDPLKNMPKRTASLNVFYPCSLWAPAQLQTSFPVPSLCDYSCNISRNLSLSECNTKMNTVMDTETNRSPKESIIT